MLHSHFTTSWSSDMLHSLLDSYEVACSIYQGGGIISDGHEVACGEPVTGASVGGSDAAESTRGCPHLGELMPSQQTFCVYHRHSVCTVYIIDMLWPVPPASVKTGVVNLGVATFQGGRE